MDKYVQLLQYSLITFQRAGSIVLVAEDVKPLTEIPIKDPSTNDVKSFVVALRNLGLHLKCISEVIDENVYKTLFISAQRQNLYNLPLRSNAMVIGFHKYHQHCGLSFGFPQTAIDAFVQSTTIKGSDEEGILRNQFPCQDQWILFKVLHPFMLSRAHWMQEIEVVKTWIDVFHKSAPEITRAILDASEGN